MNKNNYWVYIATNNSLTLYTGITNNLIRRMYEHRKKLAPGFTSKYNIHKLIYFHYFDNPKDAIAAEKKIKGWTRTKKLALIRKLNPTFKDLNPSANASG